MSREAHVRICGGLEVKFLRSTRPAISGRKPIYLAGYLRVQDDSQKY